MYRSVGFVLLIFVVSLTALVLGVERVNWISGVLGGFGVLWSGSMILWGGIDD